MSCLKTNVKQILKMFLLLFQNVNLIYKINEVMKKSSCHQRQILFYSGFNLPKRFSRLLCKNQSGCLSFRLTQYP